MKYILFVSSIIFSLIVLLPTNSNCQWIQTNGPSAVNVRALAVNGNNIFAGTEGDGVFLSTNNGNNWNVVNNGLPNNTFVNVIAIKDTNLFIGTFNGIFLSTNNGSGWTAVDSGLTQDTIRAFVFIGKNLFAGSWGNGVFRSTNNGSTWTAVNSGLTNSYIYAFSVVDTNLFVGSLGGVFLSTNNGNNWTPINSGLTDINVWSLATSSDGTGTPYLFAGTYSGGVFRSTNTGNSWSNISTSSEVYTLIASGTNLFTGTQNGIFCSTNNGNDWNSVSIGLSYPTIALAFSGTNLFVGTYGAGVWRRPLSEMVTSVEQTSSRFPEQIALFQNFPNPFNPSTTISFSIPSKSHVSLKVFDALGREVSNLLSEEMSPGTYTKQWYATNLPSGIYFYRLQAGLFETTKKLVLLR